MKDKFIYINGIIYTNDIKRKRVKQFKTYKYQDNISDILATENIIEYLENKQKNIIKKQKKEIAKYNKNNDKVIIFGGVISSLTALIISAIPELYPTNFLFNIIGPISLGFLCVGTVGLLLNKIETNYYRNKDYNYGRLEKINEEIINNSKKLINLEENTKIIFEDNYKNNKVIEISYKEKLIELRKLIELYGKIACNKDKYKKYYDRGIIDKKLETKYNEEERKLIKKYFSDNTN